MIRNENEKLFPSPYAYAAIVPIASFKSHCIRLKKLFNISFIFLSLLSFSLADCKLPPKTVQQNKKGKTQLNFFFIFLFFCFVTQRVYVFFMF